MIERLANVIYWVACGIAGLIAALAIVMAFGSPSEAIGILLAGAAFAALAWAAGKAVRYILVG